MNHKNTLSWKYVIYLGLFLVTAAVTFISMHYQAESAATLEMTEAEFPLVYAEADDGLVYNPMHGIIIPDNAGINGTNETSDKYEGVSVPGMDTPLTPLPDSNELKIAVDTYGSMIKDISYKIRDTRDNSLIESTSLNSFESSQSRVHAVLPVKDLLSENVEYMLEICINTEKQNNIRYYTRIVTGRDDYFKNSIDFVLDFNNDTYNLETSSNISKYMETKYGSDNSNFGSVDIYCNTDSVLWGDIDPFIESNVIPTVESIEQEIMIVSLDYSIGAENVDGTNDTYAVHEYYRVRQGTMGMFLLAFKREANQIFDGRDDLFPSGKINLGIQNQLTVQAKDSDNHNFTCFETYGSLWSYSKSANEFIRVFSFDSGDSDNVRERYQRHKIKIMDISDDGSIKFIVYGYMNRGAHEGRLGVSLYQYNYGGNSVEELLFLPLDMPYEIIEENVGDISYVNSSNIFYIMINDSLYAVELNSKEIMTEIEGLTSGTYKVSDNGRIIAYSLNGQLNNTDSIRILNLEKGVEKILKAPDNQVMKVLGFIENDCIYGYANIDDIAYEDNGLITYLIHTLCIMDDNYEVIKEYHEDGIYLSGVEVDGYRVNLSRVVKDGEGGYTSASIDQLINRSENSVDERVSVDSVYTPSRRTEVVLVLPKGVGDVNSTTARGADNIQFVADRELVIEKTGKAKKLYYVYGAGRLAGSYDNINSAVIAANSNYGYVKDYNNKLVWTKYKTTTGQIKGITTSSADFGGSYQGGEAVVKSYIGDVDNLKKITLKGVSYETVLPYISRGKPVLAKTANGYVIITAYDATSVTYLGSGKEINITTTDAAKLFTQGGNLYVTFY